MKEGLIETLDALLALDLSADGIEREIERTETRLVILQSIKGIRGKQSSGAAPRLPQSPQPVKKKPAKKPGPKKAPVPAPAKESTVGDIDKVAFKVGVYLQENGPRRRDAIRNAVGTDDEALNKVLERPWFEKDGAYWTLSSDGFVHFNASKEP